MGVDILGVDHVHVYVTWEGERREERRRRKVEREGKEKRKEGVGKMI